MTNETNKIVDAFNKSGGRASQMTLRDYFAAKVLQALIPEFDLSATVETAQWAYQYADAMLEARKQ